MNYLHYNLHLAPGEAIKVTLDKQANVRLLNEANYQHYKKGAKHKYYGGLAKKSPVILQPPNPGHWHLVIDLGGYAGKVQASVQTVKASD